ncbi:MAG: PA-phosphatase, partial [Acidimicrobiales bacterium]
MLAWNEHAIDALIGTAGQAPNVAVLHMAMVQGAVDDAVNAIDGGFEPYLVAPPAKRWYSTDAAAATAAYGVLVSLLPAQQAQLGVLYQASLDAIPDGRAKNGGIRVGEAAAAAMLAARADDGRFGPFRFPVGTEPGEWRPVLPAFVNDPNGWVARVTPFLIEGPEQFRS